MVDDDPDIRALLKKFLSKYLYQVSTAADGAEMLGTLEKTSFNLIILDLMLPDIYGIELCKRVRKASSTPIILLTASQEEQDYISGLESGADDYAQKPCNPQILLAKIKAVLRRSETKQSGLDIKKIAYSVMRFASWEFYPKEGKLISPDSVELYLTDSESRLLILLLEHPKKPVSREKIGEKLNVRSSSDMHRAVDSIVYRFRNKLKNIYPAFDLIKTVRNKGYKFLSDVERE